MSTPESKTKALARGLLARYDIQPASKAGTFKQAAGWYYFFGGSDGYGPV